MESRNLILLSSLEKLNSSFAGEKELQANTIKGLDRLGDSLASMKVELRKTEELGGRLEEVSLKQLSQEQEITRSTGRLNQVERKLVDSTQLREEVEVLGGTLTNTRNTLAELLTKVDNLQSEGGTTGSEIKKKSFSAIRVLIFLKLFKNRVQVLTLTCFSCKEF